MDYPKHKHQFEYLTGILKSELNEAGFWTGELSSSALATAVSIVALGLGDAQHSKDRIERGLQWLVKTINPDGGYGDSPESLSNVSTTMLCYAAFRFYIDNNRLPAKANPDAVVFFPEETIAVLERMEGFLGTRQIDLKSTSVVESILGFYGKDYTFSLPILSMLVICRVLDDKALDRIPQLPFELALLPASLYHFFNLQVVSYALPALIAVGIYLFRHKNRWNPLSAFIRKNAIKPALQKLLAILPESGGYLEAIPLTAFVAMCLIKSGFGNHQVVGKGMGFLMNLQREDGSWPIDTNLSTWVTTLGIKAMGNSVHETLSRNQVAGLREHILAGQYKTPHPFNHSKPGGWGWTSFSGSVPDADDTAGAIIALSVLKNEDENVKPAMLKACQWLASVQNRGGGIPTFCKGWGRLPFDSSCADLTGHAVLAWCITLDNFRNSIPESSSKKLKKSIRRALCFLEKEQRTEGSWLPLWFGNQRTDDKTNPVYGTARVTAYLRDALGLSAIDEAFRVQINRMLARAEAYLIRQQNPDGSWGGAFGVQGSIEETALAISALSATALDNCNHGFDWLDQEFQVNGLQPKPIGLYFASLWYSEKMYPLVYYLEALRKGLPPRQSL